MKSILFWSVHVFFLIAAQAYAICDKTHMGGVHMAGAVGSASVLDGVVVVPLHIPPDDVSDNDDQAEVSVQDKSSEMFWCCYCSFKHLCIYPFVLLRTLVMMTRPTI